MIKESHKTSEPFLKAFLEVARIEKLSLLLSLFALLICFATQTSSFFQATFFAICFVLLNFRMLVWSWKGLVQFKEGDITIISLMVRFFVKINFFFLTPWLLFSQTPIKQHSIAFLFGISGLLIAMVCSPFLLMKAETK